MEFFRKAMSVRFRSHHDKYLLADEDEETVSQDRNGTVRNAKWTVEIAGTGNVVRLKSCYGKYLTASNMPFLLGMTGKKVLQTLPSRLDSAVEWEPIREGVLVKLRTRYGQYLRANGGVPPWRNQVTHDVPHRSATQEWILWDIEVIEFKPIDHSSPRSSPRPKPPPATNVVEEEALGSEPCSPTFIQLKSPKSSMLEAVDSYIDSPTKYEGRMIYYRLANENGEVEENEEKSFTFKGKGVEELKQQLEQETELDGILVCSQNPLTGKLHPLMLHLPPNKSAMHVVVVPSSSKELNLE